MRAARAALLLAALAAASPAAWTAAQKEQKQLIELRERIGALQRKLSDAEGSRAETADALRESERAISEANRALRELAEQVREVDAKLAALREESAGRERALTDQQALLARMLYQQYLGGKSQPLKLLLNREDPNRIARQMHYLADISRARADVISGLRASLDRLKEIARETGETSRELAAIAREQEAQRHRLEREKAARAATLTRISRDVRKQRREIGTLQRDENRLSRLVESLTRLVSRPARRARVESVPDRTDETGPFTDLKGRLRLPVRGELAGRFGAPREDSGALWKGVFIAARAGEAVRAVAAGRVVFADWLRGFGNLLIIDHGGAYMSLYGNNESLFKQVGDVIHGGDTVAAVGNSGGNPDSGLYFELRYQGRPLDPLGWIGGHAAAAGSAGFR